eukprot:SAG11_NODE_510_length_8851_cov_25.360718_9_plen_40_part_00
MEGSSSNSLDGNCDIDVDGCASSPYACERCDMHGVGSRV